MNCCTGIAKSVAMVRRVMVGGRLRGLIGRVRGGFVHSALILLSLLLLSIRG